MCGVILLTNFNICVLNLSVCMFGTDNDGMSLFRLSGIKLNGGVSRVYNTLCCVLNWNKSTHIRI